MKLSVIIPWQDTGCFWRLQSIGWIARRYRRLLPEVEVVFSEQTSCRFNRAAARNQAVRRSTGEVLLIADADTVFHVPQIRAAHALIEYGDAPWVIPYGLGRYYNVTAADTEQIWQQPVQADIPEPAQWEHKLDSTAGLLMVPREHFDAVGGYDERFDGWGYEDNAFRAALDHRVGSHQRIDQGYALHLWHPVADKDTFGQPQISANRALYEQYESGALP